MIIQLTDKVDNRMLIATREPPVDAQSSVPMESLAFNDEEYYLYTVNGVTLARRKIGSWVNISKIIPLIKDASKRELEKEIENMDNTFYFNVQGKMERIFKGYWTSLDQARDFTKNHQIDSIVSPILDFERVAHVKYLGLDFYEFFSHVTVDINIRILREKASGRVNIDQIFTLYSKIKGDRANPALLRAFYQHVQDIRVRGEKTLCGGHWVRPDSAAKFARKHGFHNHVKCITDFIGTPNKGHFYYMDILERTARQHWVATVCDNDYYGFPISFKGKESPDAPARLRGKVRKKFAASELTIHKEFTVDLTQEGETSKERVTLARRASDGWINASALVSLCVPIRMRNLNLEKDHPHLRVENELYYRDCIEKVDYETVVIPNQKHLTGKWCSVKDARYLMLNLMVSSTEVGRQITEFLNDERYAHINAQQEAKEDEDDEDDDLELIGENDFLREKHRVRKEPVFRDRKFFDEEPSSDEEPYELHGVTDDEADVIDVEDDDDDSDDDSNSDVELIPEPAPLRRPVKVNQVRRAQTRRISLPSDAEKEVEDQPPLKRARTGTRDGLSSLFVEGDDAEGVEEENDDDDIEEAHSSVDNLFSSSTGDHQETTEAKRSEPAVVPPISSIDQITSELKQIVREAEAYLSNPRKVNTNRVQNGVNELFKKLRMFNAINLELKSRTKLSNMLRSAGLQINGLNKKIENLESRWVYESKFSAPSRTRGGEPPRPWPLPAPPAVPQQDQEALAEQQQSQSQYRPPFQPAYNTTRSPAHHRAPGSQHSIGSRTPVAQNNLNYNNFNAHSPIPPLANNINNHGGNGNFMSGWQQNHPNQGGYNQQWQQAQQHPPPNAMLGRQPPPSQYASNGPTVGQHQAYRNQGPMPPNQYQNYPQYSQQQQYTQQYPQQQQQYPPSRPLQQGPPPQQQQQQQHQRQQWFNQQQQAAQSQPQQQYQHQQQPHSQPQPPQQQPQPPQQPQQQQPPPQPQQQQAHHQGPTSSAPAAAAAPAAATATGPTASNQWQQHDYNKQPTSTGSKPVPSTLSQKRGAQGPPISSQQSDSRSYNEHNSNPNNINKNNNKNVNNKHEYDISVTKRIRERKGGSGDPLIRHNDRRDRPGPGPASIRNADHLNDQRRDNVSPPHKRRQDAPQQKQQQQQQMHSNPNIRVPIPVRPLSPANNYCAANTGAIDPMDFGLKDWKEFEEEKKQKELDENKDFNEYFDGPEMDKYKNAVHFEVGTTQDLLWRRDLIFGDSEKDNVSLTRKLFCMIREQEKRGLA